MNDIKILPPVRNCVAVCGGFDAKVGEVTDREALRQNVSSFEERQKINVTVCFL